MCPTPHNKKISGHKKQTGNTASSSSVTGQGKSQQESAGLGLYSTKLGVLWSMYCLFYCNWQIPAKKHNRGVWGNMGNSSGFGTLFTTSLITCPLRCVTLLTPFETDTMGIFRPKELFHGCRDLPLSWNLPFYCICTAETVNYYNSYNYILRNFFSSNSRVGTFATHEEL